MVDKFHDELSALKGSVLDLGTFSFDMLQNSVAALKNQDRELAESVYSKKRLLAEKNRSVEEKALRLIALYQPMAKDLRAIACALRMNNAFFRIGRYGKDIAMLVEDLSVEPHIANMMNLPHMAQLVSGMLDDVITAYRREDATAVRKFSERDDVIDAMRYSIFRESVTYMIEDPRNITRCIDYVMIARYLERCGDHACDMAEQVCYMVTGEHVEIS